MEPSQIILILVTLAIGAVIGSLITLWIAPSEQKNRELEKHLNDQQDALKNYQHQVSEHFNKTADLLGEMAHSYREIHNHLAQGAQNLAGYGQNQAPQLKQIPKFDEIEVQEEVTTEITPPLDYAPRNNPYEKGTLNEEYGLEKDTDDQKVPIPNPETKTVTTD